MRKLTGVLAGVAMLVSCGTGQALTAQTLGNLSWNASNAVQLQFSPLQPGGNQPTNLPCLICGENQPQQPALFGYNNFGNTGNQSDLRFFSTSVVGGSLPNDVNGTTAGAFGGVSSGYAIGPGSPFVGQLGGATTFAVGIDSNQAGGQPAQQLQSFFFLDFTTQTVLGAFIGPQDITPTANGTGFPDFFITGLSLAGVNIGDRIGFYARISGATDGPDSFFLVPQAVVDNTPLPAAVWLFGGGLAGLGVLLRRRKRIAG